MRRMFISLVFLTSLIYLTGCASNKNLSDTSTGNIPDWYSNIPHDPNYFFATNSQTSRDMQMAVDKATEGARADIARQIQTKLSNLQKRFRQEVGTSDNSQLLSQFTEVTKNVTDESMSGTHVAKQKILKDKNAFRAYVLVEYPIGAANKALMQQLKQNNHLYTRFKASQSYKELNKEVKQYDKWKQNQGQQTQPQAQNSNQ